MAADFPAVPRRRTLRPTRPLLPLVAVSAAGMLAGVALCAIALAWRLGDEHTAPVERRQHARVGLYNGHHADRPI